MISLKTPPLGARVTVMIHGKPENGFVFDADARTIKVYLDAQYARLDFSNFYGYPIDRRGEIWEVGWGKKIRRVLEKANRRPPQQISLWDWIWTVLLLGCRRKVTYVPNGTPIKARVKFRDSARGVLVLDDGAAIGLADRGMLWVWGWGVEDANALCASRLLSGSAR